MGMKRRKILFLLGLAVATSGFAIACTGNPSSNTSPATPANNAAANELVVYSGRNRTLVGEVIQKFQNQTGAKVQVRYGDTAELAATIQEEGKNSPADVFFGQDAGALGALQKAGQTAKLPQALLSKVEARYRSPEGEWVGITGRVRTVDYNTNLVKPAELPQSIFGFTEPKWQGKIGWAPTNGSFQAFVTALRVSQGESKARQWLEGIQASDPKVFPNNVSIVEALSRGEIAIGFVNHYYLEELKQENPNIPVAHYYTGDVGSLVNVAGVAILNSAKHPQLAEQFVAFMLGKEAQTYYATKTEEYPLVQGVSPAGDLKALDQIKQPNIELSDLNDLNGTLELLQEAGVI